MIDFEFNPTTKTLTASSECDDTLVIAKYRDEFFHGNSTTLEIRELEVTGEEPRSTCLPPRVCLVALLGPQESVQCGIAIGESAFDWGPEPEDLEFTNDEGVTLAFVFPAPPEGSDPFAIRFSLTDESPASSPFTFEVSPFLSCELDDLPEFPASFTPLGTANHSSRDVVISARQRGVVTTDHYFVQIRVPKLGEGATSLMLAGKAKYYLIQR